MPGVRSRRYEPDRVEIKLGTTQDGYPFHIERRSRLAAFNSWARIATVSGATNGTIFYDERPTSDSGAFYRAAR